MLFLILLLGILIGSFLNVCIYRIPRKEDIIFTPSHCFNCLHRLAWYDLIPIFSYVFLRGKCRYCKTKISIQYPIIELLNGAAYMGVFIVYGLSKESLIYFVLFSILLAISFIDYRHLIIPNSLVIAIFILAITNIFLDLSNLINYIIGFFAVSLILLIIAILTRGKMGGGDIKLMAVSGLLLGWQRIILALIIGSFLGAILGMFLIGFKIIKRNEMIPFGPFLSIGIMVSALFSEPILTWYFKIIINN